MSDPEIVVDRMMSATGLVVVVVCLVWWGPRVWSCVDEAADRYVESERARKQWMHDHCKLVSKSKGRWAYINGDSAYIPGETCHACDDGARYCE